MGIVAPCEPLRAFKADGLGSCRCRCNESRHSYLVEELCLSKLCPSSMKQPLPRPLGGSRK